MSKKCKKKKHKDEKSEELTEEETFDEVAQQDLENAYLILYDD